MKNDIYKKLKVFHFADQIKKDFPGSKKSALIFGNFGAMNMGDESILSGELQELSKIPDLNLCVVSRNPGNTKSLHKTNAISLYEFWEVISKITKSDFIIVGGGGIICKTDRVLIGFVYQLYMLFIYLFLPLVFGKKIYAVGMGVYKNSNPIILFLSTYLLRFSSIITVRDYHSYEYLKSKKISVEIYKDNSYLMDLTPLSEIKKGKFFEMHYDSNKKNIGFALLKPENEEDEIRLISEIKTLVDKNHKTANFWFYSCDFQGNFFNDYSFSKKIRDIIGQDTLRKKSIILVPTEYSPDKFFSSFKLMDYFITMRLHGAIFAYRSDIDFMGITYDDKCTSFLRSVGKKPVSLSQISLSYV